MSYDVCPSDMNSPVHQFTQKQKKRRKKCTICGREWVKVKKTWHQVASVG